AVRAADRRVAAVVELVVGQAALANVVPAALVVPVGERVRLPELVRLVPADLRRVRPGRRLVASQSGDPGVEPAERAAERLDLADRAAEVRFALPERLAVELGLAGQRRALMDLHGRPVPVLDRAPDGVGLGEEDMRIEREDSGVGRD